MNYVDKITALTNEEEKREKLMKLAENVRKYKKLYTHFGDDLDNKSSVYAIQRWVEEMGVLDEGESLTVERLPAGQTKTQGVNVDTNGHKGSSFEEEMIVIDGGAEDKSAAMALSKMGIYVPEQIVQMADIPVTKVSPLEFQTGLALIRYLDGPHAFKLAEDHKLDQVLSNEELELYGLLEASQKQKGIIENAIAKIEKYMTLMPDGRKAVIAPENILGGSAIAYALGCDFYASVEGKEEEKCTFAVNSKPGNTLPKSIQSLGNRLVKQYQREDGSSGVFLNPTKTQLVAGGFKNPDFRVDISADKMVSLIKELFEIEDKAFSSHTPDIDSLD